MNHHHSECQCLFYSLCLATDETHQIRCYKYLEEQGEFFSEYLTYVSNSILLKCTRHRQTTIDLICLEAIDCLIVLTKLEEEIIPVWKPSGDYGLDLSIDEIDSCLHRLSGAIEVRNLNQIRNQLSNILSPDKYYDFIHSKLSKWERNLRNNNLLE